MVWSRNKVWSCARVQLSRAEGHVCDHAARLRCSVPEALDVALVTGCDRIRYASYVGHQLYARRHGLACHLELTPFEGQGGYWHKGAALHAHLADHDWVVWLDDDAFITDLDSEFIRREVQHAHAAGKWLVIAPSVDDELNGAWAAYNTGVMALRNCAESRELLALLSDPPLGAIEHWWDRSKFGVFTEGDQDVVVWFIEAHGRADGVHWVDPLRWNARPWIYTKSLTDAPVCHVPGHPDKTLSIRQFAQRLGTDETLCRAGHPTNPSRAMHIQVPTISAPEALVRRASLSLRQLTKRARRKVEWIRHERSWS